MVPYRLNRKRAIGHRIESDFVDDSGSLNLYVPEGVGGEGV